MYSRPSWPPALYEDFRGVADMLGYKTKGKQGRWVLIQRLLSYAKEHPEIFHA